MRIWHDRSYIFANSQEMISRGYAVEDIYSIRISFTYTDEEREANRVFAMTHTNEERNQDNIREAKRRSDAMLPVMEAIAEAFVCDQFKEQLPFNCDTWDLFFWCSHFKAFSVGCELQGRDYSYFTLSMNKAVSLEKRKETCERLLKLITEKFSNHPNLDVAVQYDVLFDEKKIGAEADAVLPQLMKANCIYDGQEGRIVQGGNGVFFLRKRARKYGHRLSEMDLLRLAWSLGINTGEAVAHA